MPPRIFNPSNLEGSAITGIPEVNDEAEAEVIKSILPIKTDAGSLGNETCQSHIVS